MGCKILYWTRWTQAAALLKIKREEAIKTERERQRDWIVKKRKKERKRTDSWWNYEIIMQSCDYLHSTMKGNEGNYCIESRHLLGSRDSLTMFCSLIFGNSTGNKVCIMRRLNFWILTPLEKKNTRVILAKNKKENIEWHFSSSMTSSTILD